MAPAAESGRARLTIASLAVLLAAADTYVVVLALPDIMRGVGIGLDQLQRATPIVSAFLLGYVAVLPLIGRLADLRGRVPVLVGCLAVFACGSLLTATAHGLGPVVVGRALQGVGGGGLVPATLALVADLWPPERRGLPLGVVGAVQEAGSVLGPLYGGAVLAVSGWRAIFWVNLAGAAVLALLLRVRGRPAARPAVRPAARPATIRAGDPVRRPVSRGGERGDPLLAGLSFLAVVGAVLLLVEPAPLVDSVTLGAAFVPITGTTAWASPLGAATVALGAAALLRLTWRGRFTALLRGVDAVGAVLLGVALGGVVLAFAAADPSRQALADSGPLLLVGSAVAAAAFAVRQRTAPHPLVPRATLAARAAWGALLVNLFVGAALVAALVDVPVFARATRFPDSQLGAALVLVQLLVALPVGALAGGWACQRLASRWVAASGMAACALAFVAMARWDDRALHGAAATAALLLAGLGFGLAIAPVNAALLAATPGEVHGVASALVVVARMVGMLVGLSVLTAVGLRAFYREQERIGSALTLCPTSPGSCPPYEIATRAALVHELNVIFAGAAVCALVAGVLAAALLTPGRRPRPQTPH